MKMLSVGCTADFQAQATLVVDFMEIEEVRIKAFALFKAHFFCQIVVFVLHGPAFLLSAKFANFRPKS